MHVDSMENPLVSVRFSGCHSIFNTCPLCQIHLYTTHAWASHVIAEQHHPISPRCQASLSAIVLFCRVSADCLTVCSYSFHPWQVLEHIAHLGICWHDANSLIGPGFMSCQWNNLQVEPGHTRPILLVHRSERSSGRNSWIELAKYTQMSTNARANAILGGPGSHPQRHIDGRDGSCPLPCVPHSIPIPAASPEIAEWL